MAPYVFYVNESSVCEYSVKNLPRQNFRGRKMCFAENMEPGNSCC